MAKNTSNDCRIGAVKDRSQTYNPKNDTWVKRELYKNHTSQWALNILNWGIIKNEQNG